MVRVGFLGLGTMGGPMAANIIRGGHVVKGYDISQAALDQHGKNGGIMVQSAAEAAEGVDMVFTMLPNADHVETALFGPEGAVTSMKEGTFLIDMSTIHPFKSDEIRGKLKEYKISMLDAPIGRTSVEAVEGKSLFMVGGEISDIQVVRPILELMGDTIIDCGGAGTGCRMKIVNNYMTTSLNVLTAETLTLGRAIGLDQEMCIDVLSGTPAGRGHLSTTYPAKVLNNDISPAFMIDLALKDLNIGLALASEVGVPSEVGAGAKGVYEVARDQGRGAQDWTAIFSSLQFRSGLALPEGQE